LPDRSSGDGVKALGGHSEVDVGIVDEPPSLR
jgi:hypothetical protein